MNLWLLLTVNSITFGGLLFLLSAGFSLIFGLMRIPNLTHGSFFMLGAYFGASLMMWFHLDFWLAALLSGAFIVENIMAWPGLGRLTMEAYFAKDSYLVVDCVVMATGLLVIGNFIADLLLAWSDPRIRLK